MAIGQALLFGLGVTSCDKRKSGQRRWLHLGWSLIRCDFFSSFFSFLLIPPFPFLHLRYMILDAKKNNCYFPCYMLFFFIFFSFKLAWFFEWTGKNCAFSLWTFFYTSFSPGKSKHKSDKKNSLGGGGYYVFFSLVWQRCIFIGTLGNASDTASTWLQHGFDF